MNPQMGMANSMGNLGQIGINNMMNQMGMMPMMPMMGMQKGPMTEEQKKQLRMQGYLMGKKMAEEKRKANAAKNPSPAPVQEAPVSGEINIKFNKGGSITEIKMDSSSMVAELINEYFSKSGSNQGTFNFNGRSLKPTDPDSLAEAGLKNNSQVNVS